MSAPLTVRNRLTCSINFGTWLGCSCSVLHLFAHSKIVSTSRFHLPRKSTVVFVKATVTGDFFHSSTPLTNPAAWASFGMTAGGWYCNCWSVKSQHQRFCIIITQWNTTVSRMVTTRHMVKGRQCSAYTIYVGSMLSHRDGVWDQLSALIVQSHYALIIEMNLIAQYNFVPNFRKIMP